MQIITANSLRDGRVVFQTPTGWSHDISFADVLDTAEALETALDRANLAAARNRVVEPYAIDVKRGPGGLVPTKLRERIRAEGPTAGNSKSTPPPCGEGLGEGSSPPSSMPENPSPSRFASTLSPQGGEGSPAPSHTLRR